MNNSLLLSWRLGMALLFGALSVVAHGPIHAWWFAPGCLAGWLLSIQPGRPVQNFVLGFAFGIGWFTAGLWWIGTGLFNLTDLGAAGAVVITTGLVVYLSCFPAIAGTLIGQVGHPRAWPTRCILVAACWTTTAWLRGTILGGIPWLSVATGQLTGPLSQWAPVGGSLLVEFVTLLVAAALADAIAACAGPLQNRLRIAVSALAIGCVLSISGYLKTIHWTESEGGLTVRLAQGNLPQQEKFGSDGLRRAAEIYGAAIANSQAQLTVLPETAFPMTWESLPSELKRNLRRFADENQTAVMLGALMQERSRVLTNDLLLITPDARQNADGDGSYDARYTKHHLVFMGEYLPANLAWLGRRMNVAYSTLSPGVGPIELLEVGSARIAPTICFESLFGAANASNARDANLLVNISNFAWFAGTWAIDQDLDVVRMRSLETGRWTARASNSGTTAFIDDHGNIVDALPEDTSAVLDGEVDLRTGLTPYDRAGDLPSVVLCATALLVWAAMGLARLFAARQH